LRLLVLLPGCFCDSSCLPLQFFLPAFPPFLLWQCALSCVPLHLFLRAFCAFSCLCLCAFSYLPLRNF
jgi:hypothetical protein